MRELAAFLAELREEDLPAEVKRAAADSVLDTVSAAVGGAAGAIPWAVERTAVALYGGEGGFSIWGGGSCASGPGAAFLNAMHGHVLELDDVHTASKVHIGTVVIPAAWAATQALGRPGREFLLAVVCGYETAARIGMAFGVSSHRERGWHATSTAGVFGAAAACGKLLGLGEEAMVSALGLAGTQASGTWAFLRDGANCKVLHPGMAAASGYKAAWLAGAGMTGAEHILDGRDGGLLTMMTGAPAPERVAGDLGKVWEITRVDRKPYPCCRSTHCAIDGVLALRREENLTADQVETVRVSTYQVGFQQCGEAPGSLRPSTPGEAKFSTPYVVACALLRGEVTLQDFTLRRLGEEKVRALVERITVVPEERFTREYPAHWGCMVEVLCRDGRCLRREVTDASGSVTCPLSAQRALEKSVSLLTPRFQKRAKQVARELLGVGDLIALPGL